MEPMFAHDAAAVLALLRDPAFKALADEAVRDYLDWDELLKRPLPAGLSADDTWTLLTTLRRFGSTRFPIRDMHGRVYWYTLTREAVLCIDAIERYCRTDSAVHRAILHRHGQRLLVDSRIREAIAACQLDGVVVSEKPAERLLRSGRAPRTSVERLVLNSYEMLFELDDMGDTPFTPELLRRLYDRLLEGVDVTQLRRTPVRHGLTDRVETDPVSAEKRAEVILQFCAYANGEIGDPSEPVAMKVHALFNLGHYWTFMPDFNGIIGRCVFRMYAARRDYPVLGLLPVSSLYKDWTEGRSSAAIVRFKNLNHPRSTTDTDIDYTADVITYLQLTIAALDELLNGIERVRRRDAEVRSVLEHDSGINYRQRSIISHALAHPELEFRIREHQTTHNVVYATARADLLGLVERGFLRKESRGKAFVFVAVADLTERLDRADDTQPGS